MNQTRIRAAGLALAAALAAGACVTQQSYDKLAAEKGGEIDALKLEQKRLEGEAAKLQAQVKDLEAQRAQLEQQRAELSSQVGALEQERTQLKSASDQSQAQYAALVGSLNEEVKKGELQVRQYKDMLTVNVAEQVFFDSGKATLKSSGLSLLEKVGQALKGYDDKVIRVVGHTDNVPVSKALQQTFPSNWELSVARATTVVRYLEKAGIPPERMIAAGRAEFEPVADNSTDEGRRKNRRIEITLLNRELVQETTPAK